MAMEGALPSGFCYIRVGNYAVGTTEEYVLWLKNIV